MRGLVKMLDSNYEVLSAEAVVAIRTLLQQRDEDSEKVEGSGAGGAAGGDGGANTSTATRDSIGSLGSDGKPKSASWTHSKDFLQTVVSQLIKSLQDLTSNVARASVVWIIGEYQSEVPLLAPDAVRMCAKNFSGETIEMKHQIMSLALKVWAFYFFSNPDTEIPVNESVAADRSSATDNKDGGGSASSSPGDTATPPASLGGKGKRVPSTAQRKAFLERLELLVDYVCDLAKKDPEWDLRDMARVILRIKTLAKEGEQGGTTAEGAGGGTAEAGENFAKTYCGIFAKKPSSDDLAHTLRELTKLKAKGAETPSGVKSLLSEIEANYKDPKSW